MAASVHRGRIGAVLVAVGCGVPDGSARLQLAVSPGDQALRDEPALVGRFDKGTAELAVRHADREVARGPTTAGEVLRFTVEGRRYELALGGVYTDSVCDDRTPNRSTGPRNVVCRDYTWLPARLSSPDGPLPGSTPTLRGARSRQFLYTALPGLLAGALTGWALLTVTALGLALVLAVLVGGCALGWYGFESLFAFTYGLAFLVYAVAGLFAAVAWHENSRAAGLVVALGAVLGAVPVVLAMPLWSEGSPLVAVAAGALAVIVLAVIVYAVTTALGDEHPASRWLLGTGGAAAPVVKPRVRRPRRRKKSAPKD